LTPGCLGLSLAQQIAELDEPTPAGKPFILASVTPRSPFITDFDPEDEQHGSPDLLKDVVEVREHYIEVGWVHLHTCSGKVKSRDFSRPSTLRRHLDSALDPKYVGIKTSRKQLEEDNSLGNIFVDSPEVGESASQFISSEGSASEEDEGEEKVQSPGRKEEASEGEQSTPRNNQSILENSSLEKDLATTVRQRREEDRKKGRAVTKQLVGLPIRGVSSLHTTAIRVFGTAYSMPVYAYKSPSQRLIDCLP
jgi:protein AATF/BFR2